jgi:hypothetical protein
MSRDPQEEERDAALLAVAHGLTAEQQRAVLDYVADRWPRMVGAEVADILEHTTDYDMFLQETEPVYARYADQLPRTPAVIFAMHALILTARPAMSPCGLPQSAFPATPGAVLALLQQCGAVDAPRFPEVAVCIRQPGGRSEANPITIFGRARASLRRAGHAGAAPEFDGSVRRDGSMAYNLLDIAAWVTLLDDDPVRASRRAADADLAYDPVRDLAAVVEAVADPGLSDMLDPRAGDAVARLREHAWTGTEAGTEARLRELLGGEG